MLSMCMPVLVLTLAVDGGEWLDSAPPPGCASGGSVCPIVSLHA